tara:strand:- start:396 stop:533 length:138 start_codon:yes stop_codon:yes gene_type:complete
MSSCCTRERKRKDYLFLPFAIIGSTIGLGVLLTIEMGIAYTLGYI